MKKFVVVLLAVIVCLGLVSLASAEVKKATSPSAVKKDAFRPPMTNIGGGTTLPAGACPDGYEKDAGSTPTMAHCKRKAPTGPLCPPGYDVKQNPCVMTSMADAGNPIFSGCAWACVPKTPNVTMGCPSGYMSSVGPCEAGCQMIPR